MLPRLLPATLVALLLPAAATADPPWTTPVDVSRPHLFIAAPGVAVAGNGTAIAAWGWQDGTKLATATTGSAVAFRAADWTWAAEIPVRGAISGPPVAYGSRSYSVPTATASRTNASRSTLAVVSGRVGAAPGRPQRVFSGRNVTRNQLAGNAKGVQAFAWMQRNGGTRDRVYVALRRRAGGAFSRPRVLATERVRNVAVAVGARGHVIVAWDARGVVRARVARPGHGFGRAQTIRSKPANTLDLRAAIAATGRAYVAWNAQLRTEGGTLGPGYFQASVRPAGGRFGRAALLETVSPDRGVRGVALALDPAGGANVAWVGFDGTSYHLHAARLTGGGPVARDIPAGAGDYDVTDLAGHTIMLTRFDGGDTGSGISASHEFAAPEQVTPREEAYGARVALLPGGHPLTVFVNRPTGSIHPIAAIRTYLQASSR